VDRYAISISPQDPDKTSATIAVEFDEAGLQALEISVHIGNNGEQFSELISRLDFPLLMEHIVTLSNGQLPMRPEADAGETSVTEGGQGNPLSSRAYGGRSRAAGPGDGKHQARRRSVDVVTDAPSDLAVTYWRLGSAAKVAQHYEVTREIARGWISDLQRGGKLPSQWRAKRVSDR
jgi:hypothetical protein